MKARKGFTLIELMIVVFILALLSAVAAPRFERMLRKSKEGRTKGALADLRAAVSMYYASEDGTYPRDPAVLVPRYLDSVPPASLGAYHDDRADSLTVSGSSITLAELTDAGGWIYTSQSGSVAVNCSHDDTLGNPIYTW